MSPRVPEPAPNFRLAEGYRRSYLAALCCSPSPDNCIIHLGTKRILAFRLGATVAQWTDYSPPTIDPRWRHPRAWKTWRTLPLLEGFSRGAPVSPAFAFRQCSIPTSIHPHRRSLFSLSPFLENDFESTTTLQGNKFVIQCYVVKGKTGHSLGHQPVDRLLHSAARTMKRGIPTPAASPSRWNNAGRNLNRSSRYVKQPSTTDKWEPVATLQPRGTECIPTTHKRAARSPLHTSCGVHCRATSPSRKCKLASNRANAGITYPRRAHHDMTKIATIFNCRVVLAVSCWSGLCDSGMTPPHLATPAGTGKRRYACRLKYTPACFLEDVGLLTATWRKLAPRGSNFVTSFPHPHHSLPLSCVVQLSPVSAADVRDSWRERQQGKNKFQGEFTEMEINPLAAARHSAPSLRDLWRSRGHFALFLVSVLSGGRHFYKGAGRRLCAGDTAHHVSSFQKCSFYREQPLDARRQPNQHKMFLSTTLPIRRRDCSQSANGPCHFRQTEYSYEHNLAIALRGVPVDVRTATTRTKPSSVSGCSFTARDCRLPSFNNSTTHL
ncbi:hypothetical protein PR048_015379 [Dryococelus australis]|uniref:Uncharacterized protein n=1 Tax=Dryococelus australis TaxID=614101 RepID=A0ABQ9HGY4_9NEOP|nr:hypothetical protein PR048_015379 [Dryococelus australis]